MILIATRHNLHAQLTVEAAEAGKHVFVEKPAAMSMAEWEHVRETLQKTAVHYLVQGLTIGCWFYGCYAIVEGEMPLKEKIRERAPIMAVLAVIFSVPTILWSWELLRLGHWR